MNNGDKPAMPISEEETDRIVESIQIFTGLTKREHFAAMAMQGIVVNAGRNGYEFHQPNNLAEQCVQLADALLEELNK